MGKTPHPQDRKRVLATFTTARETGVGGIVEYRIARKDKQIRWLVDRFNWKKDPDGRICSLHGIVADVASRKQAETALLQSEQRYRSFVQNFQGMVYQGHMNFVPIFFHGAVEKTTGYREAEFVAGRPQCDEVIHADDFAVIAQAEEDSRFHCSASIVPAFTRSSGAGRSASTQRSSSSSIHWSAVS